MDSSYSIYFLFLVIFDILLLGDASIALVSPSKGQLKRRKPSVVSVINNELSEGESLIKGKSVLRSEGDDSMVEQALLSGVDIVGIEGDPDFMAGAGETLTGEGVQNLKGKKPNVVSPKSKEEMKSGSDTPLSGGETQSGGDIPSGGESPLSGSDTQKSGADTQSGSDTAKSGGETQQSGGDAPSGSDSQKSGSDNPLSGSDTQQSGSEVPQSGSDTQKSGSDTQKSESEVPQSGNDSQQSKGDSISTGETSLQLQSGSSETQVSISEEEKQMIEDSPYFKWQMGTVPYVIDTNSYDAIIVDRIQNAMKVIEGASCVIFKPIAKPREQSFSYAWLHFTNPDMKRDCVHSVTTGNNWGEVIMTLGFDCMQQRDILHALLHSLYFKDEVTHPQRNNYIRVLWENIQPKYRSLFHIRSDRDSFKTMVEYDTMSVMHFHDRAFSINGGATIASLIPGLEIKPSDRLSQLDIMKLRIAYGQECNKRKVDNLLETCKNTLKGDESSRDSMPLSGSDSAATDGKSGSDKKSSESSDKDSSSDNDGKKSSSSSSNDDNSKSDKSGSGGDTVSNSDKDKPDGSSDEGKKTSGGDDSSEGEEMKDSDVESNKDDGLSGSDGTPNSYKEGSDSGGSLDTADNSKDLLIDSDDTKSSGNKKPLAFGPIKVKRRSPTV